jgi:diguanylate cyclase (GGDEF)-like protein
MRQGSLSITATIDVETLERLAVTDPLTGLANRRGGERSVASEISRARRQKTSLSCIFIDIDHFKRINDTFGHQAGDRLLRDLSDLLRRTLRAYDILIRWGGEEFLLILPGVNLDQARRLAERIRAAVERLDTLGLGTVTISAGISALDGHYDFETMLMSADRRLYQAKTSGRNAIA